MLEYDVEGVNFLEPGNDECYFRPSQVTVALYRSQEVFSFYPQVFGENCLLIYIRTSGLQRCLESGDVLGTDPSLLASDSSVAISDMMYLASVFSTVHEV